jgi:hypothetical protein
LEGDLVAERLELADVVALGAFGVDAGVVEAGAQVLEPCGRVGQQMPDDDHVPDDEPSSAGRLGCLAKASPATEVIRLRTLAAWLIHHPPAEPAQPAAISPFVRIRQPVGLGCERTRLPERLSHDQSW